MHGGVIYICGKVDEHQLGKDVTPSEPTDDDVKLRKVI